MENENQYFKTIQKLTDAICVCDTKGRIKMFNKAAEELWGSTPELNNDLFTGPWQLQHRDGSLVAREQHPVNLTLREQKSVQGAELTLSRPDGTIRYVIPFASPLFNVEGELAGVVSMLIDITDRVTEQTSGKNN